MSALAAADQVDDRFDRVGEIGVSEDAYWLGKCADAFGDPELALEYFRRALALAAGSRETARRRATLGAALCRSGAHDEALAVLLASVEIDPSFDTNRESYTALVDLRRSRGELGKALDLAKGLEPVLRTDPHFVTAYDRLLAAIDGREPNVTALPPSDPFAGARACWEARRREADTLKRHVRAFAEPS
ncbi:MAG TPA: tetratricopeptide repeat protein [Gaiellaceae bacterium]|nr:tetratricopeptide repeat protein [Gaiellaceae bacterium]